MRTRSTQSFVPKSIPNNSKGECSFRLPWANGSMLRFSANNQRYSWPTCFLIYWTVLNLLLKQSIGFPRLFLLTGEVCFQKSVRVSSPTNLAVLKNPDIFIYCWHAGVHKNDADSASKITKLKQFSQTSSNKTICSAPICSVIRHIEKAKNNFQNLV